MSVVKNHKEVVCVVKKIPDYTCLKTASEDVLGIHLRTIDVVSVVGIHQLSFMHTIPPYIRALCRVSTTLTTSNRAKRTLQAGATRCSDVKTDYIRAKVTTLPFLARFFPRVHMGAHDGGAL